MGLDVVEILMGIEGEFGISIAEEEIPHFQTVFVSETLAGIAYLFALGLGRHTSWNHSPAY